MPIERRALLMLAAAGTLAASAVGAVAAEQGSEKVLGIGGFFFRAKDPKALAAWYRDQLGVAPIPADYDALPWQQQAGPTAFAPFPMDTDYFGDAHQTWMINFRVSHLDRMVAQLKAAGTAVKVDPKLYPNGRFAHLQDPEGNPVELWEPANPRRPKTG
jgi:glyoxylase I family protein